jgi:REP element-mobilizing transposase RayT
MAVRNRIFIPNEIYFLTFTILGWKHIFTSDKYRLLVYKWFDYIKREYGNKIHGYVIMPNHLHCLIFISDKSPKLSTFIQNAKRFLAYQIVRLLKEEDNMGMLDFFRENARMKFGAKHKVFEDGFDSLIIQSQKLFLEKLNYIHNNPCREKWSLAENPENYIHSSASNYVLERGIYDVDVIEL